MSTAESSSPTNQPKEPAIFTEFKARLKGIGRIAEGGPSRNDLMSFNHSLRGAAVRTGASEVLYPVDTPEVAAGAAGTKESSAPETPTPSAPALGRLTVDAEFPTVAVEAQNAARNQTPPPQIS